MPDLVSHHLTEVSNKVAEFRRFLNRDTIVDPEAKKYLREAESSLFFAQCRLDDLAKERACQLTE